MIKSIIVDSYWVDSENGIGKNNLVILDAIFVKKTWNIVDKAGATDDIAWVSYTTWVFASDNETKAKKVVNFAPKKLHNKYEVTIEWGTVTAADENKTFDLKTETSVDWTTKGTGTKLRLVKFLSAKKWIFEIL